MAKKCVKLKDQVGIYTVSTTSDGMGGTLGNTLTLERNTKASVKQMNGTKGLQYQQILSSYPYEILLLKRSDLPLTEEKIIRYDSKDLTIHSVVEADEDKYGRKPKYLMVIAYHER